MKLRNKKTGEIQECVVTPIDENGYPNEYYVFEKGKTLAELNENWEDCEPEEGWWYIGLDRYEIHTTNSSLRDIEKDREIGNYFETKEEAERAVEKLKAFKRLKDKGFEINDWAVADNYEIRLFAHYSRAGIKDDLDLLFGGEE